jgi:signal transduction histidine kinase
MNISRAANGVPRGHILVVDDSHENLILLETILNGEGYTTSLAGDGKAALIAVAAAQPDLVLLDVHMPVMDGYTVCQALKADPATRDVPVIFISSSDETLNKVRAFEVGGIDYVTKPLHLEELLARANAHIRLYRSQREKDRFLRTLSHDLKNPINLITGAVELLRDTRKPVNGEQREQLLDIIDRKAKFMEELVNDLLDLARIEAGAPPNLVEAALNDILESTLHGFDILANRKRIALFALLPSREVKVYADPMHLSRAFSNLLTNALKYTPEGGQVKLEVRIEGASANILVIDTGLGIPEEDIPRLFEPFFRGTQSKHVQEEGTGLGLAIAHAIIKQHGGSISVESRVGEGSTFTVTLPIRT